MSMHRERKVSVRDWLLSLGQCVIIRRITATEELLDSQKKAAELGILIGFWDEKEFEDITGKKFENLKPVGKKEK